MEDVVRMRSSFLLLFWVCCAIAVGGAQALRQAPTIDKIDPPDWFTTLPSPMLLVHGENLDQARFAVEGKDVQLTKTQISANGHWAILWLDTEHAATQTLRIQAE